MRKRAIIALLALAAAVGIGSCEGCAHWCPTGEASWSISGE